MTKIFPILVFLMITLGSCKKDKRVSLEEEIFDYPNTQSVGYSAYDMLSSSVYQKIILEINCYNIYPEQNTLTEIESFLNNNLNKDNIVIKIDSLNSINQNEISQSDLTSFDASSRTNISMGDQLVINCNYYDANFEQENVLGVAFYNTSIALFGKKIESLSSGVLQPPRWQIESTVFLHELGHLLGLVNVGTQMVTNHQDEPHGHHCDNENCLMYWAVETSDVVNGLLETNSIPSLDENCKADLKGNGGK